ncbi:toxin ParE1/3/4 [Methylobacterium phyllostachyos]|uniref:Toxin ParE1/3/4 n=1 Tax=Methylobacterium phyllostachyos TaxID=582672 RepID=A0A1G9TDV2_9HYPH|nr:type II toxin-antitoxin system RelE/ParE family toxin [Methylobacterium phyllostachyos]SDM45345.1 toxin ParE1/3/4 [Methylobacterium phyllostachyos]
MTIRTTRRANLDLIEIYMSGAVKFGNAHAEHYYAGLKTLLALLEERPQMARLRDEFVRPVRLYPYRAHVVAYIEQADGILIVRVLHGRQNWARHLT